MVMVVEISSLTLASSHTITWPLIDLYKLANFSPEDLKLFKQPLPVPHLFPVSHHQTQGEIINHYLFNVFHIERYHNGFCIILKTDMILQILINIIKKVCYMH